jgi:hypothetical protein
MAVRVLSQDQTKTQTLRANAANPAKTRMETGFAGHANSCETLRMNARADGEPARIRSHSQAFAIAGTRMDAEDSQESLLPQTVNAFSGQKINAQSLARACAVARSWT